MRRAGGPVIYDVHKVYAILDTLLLLRADLEVRIHAMSSLKLLLGAPPPPHGSRDVIFSCPPTGKGRNVGGKSSYSSSIAGGTHKKRDPHPPSPLIIKNTSLPSLLLPVLSLAAQHATFYTQ